MANVKLVYINGTGGYVQSTATTDVAQNIGKIELTGVGGVALDAGAAKLSNLGAPSVSTDAATKGYVDTVATGLSWTAPVVAVADSAVTLSGSQTVDGVTLANGARVLITGQNGATPDSANGIYIVNTSGAWTRSSDVLQPGTAMFVTEGTTYADTQWVLTTDTSPIVPGTTAIIFDIFGASIAYVGGSGIDITGATISVIGDSASAINVDAALGVQVVADTASALYIDPAAGLQVVADGVSALTIDPSAGLQVKADTNYGLGIDPTTGLQISLAADPGLEFSTGDLRIKVASANELSLDASGLNVEGVPTQFKIGSTAVSANVTATNLDALTDSATYTGLHKHNSVQFAATATSTLAAGDVVYVDGAGSVDKGNANATSTSTVVGVSLGSISAAASGPIVSAGYVSGLSGLTAGSAYFLSDASAGALALYSALTSGNRAIRIGYAASTTDLVVNIQDMGVKP